MEEDQRQPYTSSDPQGQRLPECGGDPNSGAPFQEPSASSGPAKKGLQGPQDPREDAEESLSQRESAIPSKGFRPAQFIKSALCSAK